MIDAVTRRLMAPALEIRISTIHPHFAGMYRGFGIRRDAVLLCLIETPHPMPNRRRSSHTVCILITASRGYRNADEADGSGTSMAGAFYTPLGPPLSGDGSACTPSQTVFTSFVRVKRALRGVYTHRPAKIYQLLYPT